MNPLSSIAYRLNVDLIGRAVLRIERLRGERALRRHGDRPGPLSPPLACSPRLKELISRHYLRGRYASGHRPVAWVTSGGPIEHLQALGYFLIYPENHGAVCGIRRTAQDLCQAAEEAGFSRDICSYARTDIGSVLSGKTPVGRLPRPDLLVCCTNICQTVLYWYQVLAHHFRVPLVLIDTPFLYRPAQPHAVAYVRRQIEEAIPVMERVARRTLAPARLERVLVESKEAVELWMRVLERGKARPSPILAFDEFIHMAPIVEMRGEEDTTAYYRVLLAELDRRVAAGVGALRQEQRRLIWDNLPIWYRVRPLSEHLASRGVALVASSYTNAWGELAPLMDPRQPLDSLARVYLHPILNRSTGDKLRTLAQMVREYQAHGVLLHSDRSCKPYSVGQMDQRERLGRELSVPALLLEADHNDPRSFSEEPTAARLDAFLEMVLS
jgi:benzoyl-CoA reductase/2-hydroxyglutaryl-CoA dehydratase subunit BcrC/BadD/HgdB